MLAIGDFDNNNFVLLYFAYIFGKSLFKRTRKSVQNLVLALCFSAIFVFIPLFSDL